MEFWTWSVAWGCGSAGAVCLCSQGRPEEAWKGRRKGGAAFCLACLPDDIPAWRAFLGRGSSAFWLSPHCAPGTGLLDPPVSAQQRPLLRDLGPSQRGCPPAPLVVPAPPSPSPSGDSGSLELPPVFPALLSVFSPSASVQPTPMSTSRVLGAGAVSVCRGESEPPACQLPLLDSPRLSLKHLRPSEAEFSHFPDTCPCFPFWIYRPPRVSSRILGLILDFSLLLTQPRPPVVTRDFTSPSASSPRPGRRARVNSPCAFSRAPPPRLIAHPESEVVLLKRRQLGHCLAQHPSAVPGCTASVSVMALTSCRGHLPALLSCVLHSGPGCVLIS